MRARAMRSSLCASCCCELHEALRGLQLGIGLGDADDAADGRAEALLLAGARGGVSLIAALRA